MNQKLQDYLTKVKVLTSAKIPVENLIEKFSLILSEDEIVAASEELWRMSEPERVFLFVRSLLSVTYEYNLYKVFLAISQINSSAKNTNLCQIIAKFMNNMSPYGLTLASWYSA